MKIRHIFTTLALATLMGVGAFIGIKATSQKETKVAQAEGRIVGGDTVYLKASNSCWNQYNSVFGIYTWGSTGGTFTAMTSVEDTVCAGTHGVYKATIPTGDTSLSFVRYAEGTTVTQENGWNGMQNQSVDISLEDSTSNLWINSSWGKNEKGEGTDHGGYFAGSIYYETATNYSLNIYAAGGEFETEETPRIHYWGIGITSSTTTYPGNLMQGTTKTVVFGGKKLYRYTINYQSHMLDRSDVEINMILSNDGDKNKTDNIGILSGGTFYKPEGSYYSPDGWGHWYGGYSASKYDGEDARLTFLLDEDLCSLTPNQADSLRSAMDNSHDTIKSATWNGFTYTEVYAFVNSKCTTPKVLSAQLALGNNNGQSTVVVIIVAISLVSLLAAAVVIKKKQLSK